MTPARHVDRPSEDDASAIGLAVDASGRPAYDPSLNVKNLSIAANQRQDDLRAAQDALTDEKTRRLEQLITLRAEHLEATAVLRAEYAERLAVAEAKRIDAIRAVDVNAVAVASQRASDQAQVLANQVSQSAETIRTALNNTATTIAAQMDSKFAGIIERIAALEKSSYEGKGRSAYTDPMMSELMTKLDKMASAQAGTTGTREGLSMAWGIGLAVLGAAGTILGILGALRASKP